MVLALLASSLALLFLAGAAEAWRLATRQRNQALSQGAVERQLRAVRQADASAPEGPATGLPWDPVLLRAGLAPGWRMPLLALGAGLVIAAGVGLRLHSTAMALAAMVLYALVLAFLVHRRIDARKRQIVRQIPDFLDHMVRLTALGHGLPTAFQNAAVHVPPPLRPILDNTLSAVRAGTELERALSVAARAHDLRLMEALACVLGIGQKVGGRSDQILQRMSEFARDLEQAQQELGATTSETRASAWVIGLLPPLCALLMALTSPDFFTPMLEQALGRKLLLGALGLEALGAFLLYRLARSL